MKKVIFILLAFPFICCNQSSNKGTEQTAKNQSINAVNFEEYNSTFLLHHPLITLIRKTPAEIGCILQTEFNYRDSLFNCDYKNYINKGDPVKNTKAYYEGIQIPQEVIKKINPAIKEMVLQFEHGNLREINITFTDSLLKSKIQQVFKLPVDRKNFPPNIIGIEYGENIFSAEKPVNEKYTRWISIIGFDHIGAGESQD